MNDDLPIEYFAAIMALAWEVSEDARAEVVLGTAQPIDKTKGLQLSIAVLGQELCGAIDTGAVSAEEIERVLVSSPYNEREAIFLGLCPVGWELARRADVYSFWRGSDWVYLVLKDGEFGLRRVWPAGEHLGADDWIMEWDCELATPLVGELVARRLVGWFGV